jgi:3,4-dihydroxy-9,10-secoandrosta-1,3,5(10)-triene-9,17-dione 4,5-dioxygenase
MIDIRSLAYVVAETTDIPAWRRLAERGLGMAARDMEGGGLALKMDERAQRILVLPGGADRFVASGWEVADRRAFLSAVAELREAGVSPRFAGPAECALRAVQEMAWFQDPSGNRHELVWGFKSDFARFLSPCGVPRFKTGDLGMGHVVVPAPDLDATWAFMSDVMGFGLADILVHRPPGGPPQRLYFLHCNNGRHHSLALFEGHVPSGCVHLMVEVETMAEVGRALDRMTKEGVRLMCTLGQHVNDEMTSFYCATPSGFAIEFGYGGRVVDWSRHTVFESTSVSLWGHDFSVGFR